MTDPKMLADQFDMQSRLIAMFAEDLTPEDWAHTPGKANGAHWVLGHVARSRRGGLKMLGQEVETAAWEAAFGRGVDPAENLNDVATPDTLLADIAATGERLGDTLRALSTEDAAREIEADFPFGGKTIGGGATFLAFHEAYHLGQLGLLGAIHGKSGIK